ncbi:MULTISPECIES: hypothetical protein [unclassified Paracoccus (in: a-proteobacteria)]|uniref:hypothetical protein n=1 Tax=unclassified Paracoccus (in: a-proteobacteria) TaxID=2688777 RepID=UPI001F1BFEE8|nr:MULTISPECIES: hypothetical protein [unclassified Paracoccus (in: a-proteobacteria)]
MSLYENAYGTVTAVSTTRAGSLVNVRLRSTDKALEGTTIQAFVPKSLNPPEGARSRPGDRAFLMGELDIVSGELLPQGNDLALLRVEVCLRA